MSGSLFEQPKSVEPVKDCRDPATKGPSTNMDSIEAQLDASACAFALKHYATATKCFSRACESLTAHHPENHPAIIDAHLFYGKALLRNAISLGSLIGPLDWSHSLLPSTSKLALTLKTIMIINRVDFPSSLQ